MKTNRLTLLIKGELLRLHKYNVVFISVFIALVWGVVLFFVDSVIFNTLLPFLILVDATMMSLMYIGSVMFFEKKESTLSSVLVTPVTNQEIILSKIIANTIHNLFSTSLIIIVFIFIKDVEVNYILMFIAIILVTAVFTGLGLLLSYYQKDFTTMLTNLMLLMFALLLPSALYGFGVLKADVWEYILLLNPIQAAQEIIKGGFRGVTLDWKYYFSLGYLVIGGLTTYKFLIVPKFNAYAVSISGV
ncbi:MAG: ABC transporter permease [Candidatus Izemoplasmatales bacterium]|nr:ABC transporter permease [Candidatus Izemoplasmatales bacterium]